jgi:hypothetical protein
MRVKAVRRSLPLPTTTDAHDDDEGKIEMMGLDELRAQLPGTTALMLCLPGTGETEGKFFGGRRGVCGGWVSVSLLGRKRVGGGRSIRLQIHMLYLSHTHTPLQTRTHTSGLIGPQELALLPPDAILVNVGRGNAVDEGSLYAALKEGKVCVRIYGVCCYGV